MLILLKLSTSLSYVMHTQKENPNLLSNRLVLPMKLFIWLFIYIKKRIFEFSNKSRWRLMGGNFLGKSSPEKVEIAFSFFKFANHGTNLSLFF